VLGAILMVFGLLVIVGEKLPVRFGRLPGDLVYRRKNTVVYFPWVTSLLISVVSRCSCGFSAGVNRPLSFQRHVQGNTGVVELRHRTIRLGRVCRLLERLPGRSGNSRP